MGTISTRAGAAALPSQGFTSSVTITRPANATAYTAKDVVGDVSAVPLNFAAVGPVGGSIRVMSAEMEIDVTAVPAGMTSFRLYLYSVAPPSAIADNGAWDIAAGDRPAFLGYVDLGTPVDLGSTLYVRTDNIAAQFLLSDASVYAYLMTNGGFTPAGNSEVYKVTLHTVGL